MIKRQEAGCGDQGWLIQVSAQEEPRDKCGPLSATIKRHLLGTGKKYMLLADSFSAHRNTVLDESKPTTEFMMEQTEEVLSNTWYICVIDATGRTYRKFVHPFLPFLVVWSKNAKTRNDRRPQTYS
jgi:hypothetical protein